MSEHQTNDNESAEHQERESSEEHGAEDTGRHSSTDDGHQTHVKPVEKKVGESDDNLRRREEWFQRRSGRGK